MTGDRPIRILTVDDHPLLRDGIAALVALEADMRIVGEASDGVEAVALVRSLAPDIVLLDLSMPEGDGMTALAAIRDVAPRARVIILTMSIGDALATRALRAGAAGFLVKTALRNDLIRGIRDVLAGRRALSTEIAREIANHAGGETLSDREMNILGLVARGHANKRIAWDLAISEHTVKSHLKSIFEKLGASDRTHAVTIATRRGFIEPIDAAGL